MRLTRHQNCPSCGRQLGMLQANVHCAAEGLNYGPPAELRRPTGTDSKFLDYAFHGLTVPGYRELVEHRLGAGEQEYGRFQYLRADVDHEAIEELVDVGGWLMLGDHRLELDTENGLIQPDVASEVRMKRAMATRLAAEAYNIERDVLSMLTPR